MSDGKTPVIAGQTVTEPEIKFPDSGEEKKETAETAGDDVEQGEKDKGGIPHGAQEAINSRFDELTRRRYEAEREAAYWKGIAEGSKKPDKIETPIKQEDIKPVLDNFKTYDDYVDALASFNAKKIVRETQEQETKSRKEKEEKDKIIEKGKKAASIMQSGQAKYKDFNVVVNPDIPITEAMVDIITESRNPHDIVYTIAKNPEFAKLLASSQPSKIAYEIGRIDAHFSSKSKSTSGITKAPEPINPIDSGDKSSPIKMEDTDIDEWMRRWGR